MAAVGPRAEWAWIDHLSPGDALRVAWLRGIARDTQAPTDVAQAAALALAEIRRVAEQRMADAPPPGSRPAAPGEAVKPQTAVDALLAARGAVLALRKQYEGGDSDYCAGIKEACDEIGKALGMIA